MADTKAPAVGQIGWVDLTVSNAEAVRGSTSTSPAGPHRPSTWAITPTIA